MKSALKSRLAVMISVSMILALLGGSIASVGSVQASEPENTPFETEVIVRTVNQFKKKSDVTNFVSMAKQYGVDVISMNVKQDEDDEVPSGRVFYHSNIAPIAAGYNTFDALQEVITAAHNVGIKVHAWIPQFHDQEAFLKNSNWQMKALVNGVPTPFTGSNGSEYFVNPLHPEVQQYERSIIQEVVENYDVDGVVLDWIRFDDYNMDVSDYTIQKYQQQFGYSPLSINFAVNSPKRDQWNAWRTDMIGQYVGDIRQDLALSTKPDMQLGVYILPPEFVEVGQDVSKFKQYIDFIAPMAYFDDWDFNSDWVYSDQYGILKDTADRISGENVEIVATLDNDWSDDEYQEVYKGIRDNYPGIKRLSFFAYNKWPESELAKINQRTTWPTPGWTPPVEQDYPAILPAGWSARNIGQMPGDVQYNSVNQQFIISSRTTDIWGNSDQLNYIYQPISGNVDMVVQIKSMSAMDEWAKAGIMIRESLAGDAKHVDMMMTPGNGATFQYRQQTQGGMSDQTANATVPRWLKLSRSGNKFTGSISSNGTKWTKIGTVTISMNQLVYIGLAVSNPGSNQTNKAVIGNVSISQ